MVPPSTVNPYSYATPIPVDSTASMMSSSTSPVPAVYAMPSTLSNTASVTSSYPVYSPTSMSGSQPGVSSYAPIPVSISDSTTASISGSQPYSDVKPTVVDMSMNHTTGVPSASHPSSFAATPNTVTVPVESYHPAASVTVSLSNTNSSAEQTDDASTEMSNPSSNEYVEDPQE